MKNEKFELKFITIEPKIETPNEVKPVIHYKNSRRHKTIWDRNKYEEKKFVWSLSKFVEERLDDGIWQYRGSSKELNKELTAAKFVEELNTENLFDFEYLPEEKDYLHIRIEYVNEEIKGRSRPYIDAYISFIFKEGKWTINKGFDARNNVYMDFKEGIINIFTERNYSLD